jgi:tRNA pseudouridine38-40 synthase
MAVVEYDGTSYHGWQLQNNLPTIQGSLESVLERILGKPTRVHGAGRTDAGVHAVGQVAHLDANWTHSAGDLQRACNALLPADIAIRSMRLVPDEFHARHSARSKRYKYRILNATLRSPLQRLYAWHVPYRLDVASMQESASYLLGSHDFAAFGSPTDGTPSTVRKVLEARWAASQSEGTITFTIEATGFLKYMVRSIVGTGVMVGRGKINPPEVKAIVTSRNRSLSGPTAPPTGLCLVAVDYGPRWAEDQSEEATVLRK